MTAPIKSDDDLPIAGRLSELAAALGYDDAGYEDSNDGLGDETATTDNVVWAQQSRRR